jgi:cytohesin
VLAFAVIMLNTDLFNVSIKKDKKMTKQQWQSHVRGVNDGKDLPLEFVNDLYDRIRNNEIKMESETNMFARAGKKGFCMKQGGKIRTWKKRFFILSGEQTKISLLCCHDGCCFPDHQLFYFKQVTDETPLGIIPLENLVVEREDKLVKFGFRLSSTDGGFIKSVRMSKNGAPKKGNHTHYLMGASSPEEQADWIATLQQVREEQANVVFVLTCVDKGNSSQPVL